jgi:hypothetical protein
MPQVSAIQAPRRNRSRASAGNWKNLACLGAAAAYIGLGFLAFRLLCALIGDNAAANWIAAGLSVPLAVLLFRVIDRIDKGR